MYVTKGGKNVTNIEDEHIKKELLARAEHISNAINNLFNNFSPAITDLPNVGITLNNKMVELMQEFDKAGVPLDDNFLTVALVNYLINKANQASLILINYGEICRHNPNVRSLLGLEKKLQLLTDKYKRIDEEIFGFTLEKDAVKAIQYDIKANKEKEAIGGLNKYFTPEIKTLLIEVYKHNLATMGVSEQALEELQPYDTGFGSL